MVDVGVTDANWVDAQGVSLTNLSDAKTYVQLRNVITDMDKNVTKHQLSDNTVENVYSLAMNSIQGNIILTTGEITEWTVLFLNSDTKVWQVSFTDSSGVIVNLSFNGEVKTFQPIDDGEGDVSHFFRIECDEAIGIT